MSQNEYKEIIDGKIFETSDHTRWRATVSNNPDIPRQDSEDLLYLIDFGGDESGPRHLDLIVSSGYLVEHYHGAREEGIKRLRAEITSWLEGNEAQGQLNLNDRWKEAGD